MTRKVVPQSQRQTPTTHPLSSGILQRKCACGKSAGLTGKCSGCEGKRLTLQRKAVGGESEVSEVPPIVHEVLQSPTPIVQPKLTVSEPGDRYEQEADRIADQVMQTPEEKNKVEEISIGDAGVAVSGSLQRKVSGNEVKPLGVPQIVREVLKTPGEPLDSGIREFMETRFQHDFSQVRVHTDTRASESAQAVNALAYAVKQDIVFAKDQYQPKTSRGKKLLAHELVHVAQFQRDPNLGKSANSDSLQIMRCWIAERTDGHLTDASWQSLLDKLRALGLPDHEILGQTEQDAREAREAIERLSNRQISQALDLIRELRRGGVRRGAVNRIINAWINHKDDLGLPTSPRARGRERYPSILHYAVNLEWQAQISMGLPYLQAMGVMPTVTLAGATIGVHPRTVYFAAAAQAAMDIAAGIPAGQGHYVAPGAFGARLQSMRRDVPRARRGQMPEGSEETLRRLIHEITDISRTMLAQAEGVTTDIASPTEHVEPTLQDYFRARQSVIEDLARIPLDTNSGRLAAAEQLRLLLNDAPRGRLLHHGFGSIDPHGTDHALGLALDLFNGRRIGTLNFGVNAQYWPFIYYVMDHWGGAAGLDGLRPDAIHELSPRQRLDLNTVLQQHGDEAVADILGRAAELGITPGEDVARDPDFQRIVRQTRQALQQNLQALRRMLIRRRFSEDEALHEAIEAETRAIRETLDSTSELSPSQLQERISRHITALDQIYARSIRRFEASDTPSVERPAISERQRRATHRELERLPEQTRVRIAAVKEAAEEAARQRADERAPLVIDLERPVATPEERSVIFVEEAEAASREVQRIQEQARRRRTQLEELLRSPTEVEHRRRRRQQRQQARDAAPLESASPDAGGEGRSLRERGTDLATAAQVAQAAWERQQMAQLLEMVLSRRFSSWLDSATDPNRGIYDQPAILVEALDQVYSDPDQDRNAPSHTQTRFYGGHHWRIAPREIVGGNLDAEVQDPGYWQTLDITTRTSEEIAQVRQTSDSAYRRSLEHDMATRTVEQMGRILQIMAESSGGQAQMRTDSVFRQALAAWARARNISIDALIDAAFASRGTP